MYKKLSELDKKKSYEETINFIKGVGRHSEYKETEPNKFISLVTQERFTLDQIAKTFLPNIIKHKSSVSDKKNLEEIISQTKIFFIETQRLLDFNFNERENARRIEKEFILNKIETVKIYSYELSQLIQEAHYYYSKLSEELELSLGKRLMGKEIQTFSDIQELKKENKMLEDRRNELRRVGLFEGIPDYTVIPDTIDDLTKAVLSVNIQDMKNKITIFDDLYNKLNLFIDILNNRRFSYKKISIDSKRGFVFIDINGKELYGADLSSGEQHEIVMLYELLFKVKENSLVLIDEPEISLHIIWQKNFLDDLAEIVKIRNFDILIATHSPSIINGNWDITVELEKKIEQQVS